MIDGKRLKELRLKHNLTADEVASAVGVSRNQMFRYEGNQTDVTSETLMKIANFFDVSTDYLLGRSNTQQEGVSPKGTFTVDVTRLVTISPERAAHLIKAFGLTVVPNPVPIDVPALLNEFAPAVVVRFLKELGAPYDVIYGDLRKGGSGDDSSKS